MLRKACVCQKKLSAVGVFPSQENVTSSFWVLTWYINVASLKKKNIHENGPTFHVKVSLKSLLLF